MIYYSIYFHTENKRGAMPLVFRNEEVTEYEKDKRQPDGRCYIDKDGPFVHENHADGAGDEGGDTGNYRQQARYGEVQIAEKRFSALLTGSAQLETSAKNTIKLMASPTDHFPGGVFGKMLIFISLYY